MERLKGALTEAHYTLYDPFGLMPGKSYAETVKLFAAPVEQNWCRVLCEDALPETILKTATGDAFVGLMAALTPNHADVQLYAGGQPIDKSQAETVLKPFVRGGTPPGALGATLNATTYTIIDPDDPPSNVPYGSLPDNIQQMADNIDPNAMNKMFNRVASGLFGRIGADQQEAESMLNQQPLNWDSPQGRQISAIMEMLTVPAGWREPSFAALRDAYSLHARSARKPNARLYPGDAETMNAVPDALDYTPIYGGKDRP